LSDIAINGFSSSLEIFGLLLLLMFISPQLFFYVLFFLPFLIFSSWFDVFHAITPGLFSPVRVTWPDFFPVFSNEVFSLLDVNQTS